MRVLIVEDDRQIADLLKSRLEADRYAVDEADDGEKGSFLARTNDYDLVILDLGLPKKDGRVVCREIRETGKTMPILLLTVRTEVDTKVEMLRLGADDYLTKPFAYEEFLARVQALLRRPRTLLAAVKRIGGLELDPDRQSCTLGGKEIHLTRKEFMLLEYFMDHPGIVLSRAQIMEHVWDGSIDAFSNTVDMHIANVRRKIDPKEKDRFIQTVAGVGFRMVTPATAEHASS